MSPRRVDLGLDVDDDRLHLERRERDVLGVLAGQREVIGGSAGFEHLPNLAAGGDEAWRSRYDSVILPA